MNGNVNDAEDDVDDAGDDVDDAGDDVDDAGDDVDDAGDDVDDAEDDVDDAEDDVDDAGDSVSAPEYGIDMPLPQRKGRIVTEAPQAAPFTLTSQSVDWDELTSPTQVSLTGDAFDAALARAALERLDCAVPVALGHGMRIIEVRDGRNRVSKVSYPCNDAVRRESALAQVGDRLASSMLRGELPGASICVAVEVPGPALPVFPHVHSESMFTVPAAYVAGIRMAHPWGRSSFNVAVRGRNSQTVALPWLVLDDGANVYPVYIYVYGRETDLLCDGQAVRNWQQGQRLLAKAFHTRPMVRLSLTLPLPGTWCRVGRGCPAICRAYRVRPQQ